MKLNQSKEWYEDRIPMEEDCDISAGCPLQTTKEEYNDNMITNDEVKRFHAAARMIELDGGEGYFSCRDKFGADIAGAALVMYLRGCQMVFDECPRLGYVDEEFDERVNEGMRELGRLTPKDQK